FLGGCRVCNRECPIGIRNYGLGVNQHGGIIRATGAIFRNNGQGVEMKPYNNFSGNQPIPNRSAFTDCQFTNTTDYSLDVPFKTFVSLDGVNGIRFTGCTFINDYVPVNFSHYEYFGKGIDANSSGFVVRANNLTNPCIPPS